jgi:hypothetical protein
MFGEAATEDVPSSYHRDAGYGIFFGRQAIGFADEKSHLPERRYQRRLDHGEAESDDEGEENRDGVEVNELGSCLRVESVREGRGSEDGMCWRTCRPCLCVRCCIHNILMPNKQICSSAVKRRFGVDKPSVSSIAVSLAIHICCVVNVLALS